MKLKRLLATAVMITLTFSACGGGGDNGSSETSTPEAKNATLKLSSSMMNILGSIPGFSMPGLYSRVAPSKSVDSPECDDTSCSVSIGDSQGGTCDLNYYFSDDGVRYTATVTASCSSFHDLLEPSTVINGSYTLEITVNTAAALPTVYSSAHSANKPEKASVSKEDASCDASDGSIPACEETEESCSETDAYLQVFFTIGSGGLTITDTCGTYNFGSGTTIAYNTCVVASDGASTGILMSVLAIGTFNGDTVGSSYNFYCDDMFEY